MGWWACSGRFHVRCIHLALGAFLRELLRELSRNGRRHLYKMCLSISPLAPSPAIMGPAGVSDIFYTAVTPSETEVIAPAKQSF